MIDATMNVLSKIALKVILGLCSTVAIILGFILIDIGANENTAVKGLIYIILGILIEFTVRWCWSCLLT